jgi:hypothetical protein
MAVTPATKQSLIQDKTTEAPSMRRNQLINFGAPVLAAPASYADHSRDAILRPAIAFANARTDQSALAVSVAKLCRLHRDSY